MWQMAGLGPMAGQAHHFSKYAPEPIPYAVQRYVDETGRLYGVLDIRLASREYVGDSGYSIADIAIWPWVALHELHEQDLAEFPNVSRWFDLVGRREAVRKGMAVLEHMFAHGLDEQGKKIMFGQRRRNVGGGPHLNPKPI
jgi:GST-like protein